MRSRRIVSLTLLVPLALCVLPARLAAAADPAGTCAASKRKAAGKKAAAKLNCYATAAKKGVAVDPDCITKAEVKFQTAFDKADAKGGCAGTGDAARVEGDVNALV